MSISKPYKCEYCGSSFTREKTLAVHMCEKKRRHLQKKEKHVQLGYYAFTRFYKLSAGTKKEKTYEDFCNSPYYNAFVKFGSFISNVRPLYPERYIDHVVKSGVKLDHWCRDELYDTYLFEMLKIEPVESAVQRSIQTMMDWGDKQEAPYNDYFKFVNLNRAVNDIRTGRISPWLLLNSSAGHKLVESLNDEQIQIVEPTLDIIHWRKTFANKPADVKLVKEIIKEANIA